MFARVKLEEETASQKSTVGKVLEWMQEHPNQCKNTNATVMAKSMELSKVGPINSLRQGIQRMANNQMLYRQGTKRRSNFYINYMHRDIPPYVLENAPEADQDARAQAEAKLEDNQHLDDVGCVVTEPEEKEEPVEEAEKDEEYPELEEIIEHISTVPVMVRKEKTNGSTNISITLNLNLNN